MHDEPFWRRSNEVKRLARYQREFRTGPGLHNLSVFRIDNFRRVDHVLVLVYDPLSIKPTDALNVLVKQKPL
jgi:hypothetical protein